MSEKLVMPWNWNPRRHQAKIWKALTEGCRNLCWVVHRSGGKDWTALNWTSTAAMQHPGLYWHMLPYFVQARSVAWTNTTNEGKCYRSAFPGWDHPGDYEAGPCIVDTSNDKEMRMDLASGAIWQLMGSDRHDRLRGPNPRGVVHSEYAFANPLAAEIIEPKLDANGGWQLYISTPNGRNHFFRLMEYAKANPWHPKDNPTGWFCEILTIDDTRDEDGRPIVTPEQIQKHRERGKDEEWIQREFYCSFNTSVEGSYYGKTMVKIEAEGRVEKVGWDPRRPVHTAWDIGHDATAIWFFQYIGNEVHFIDYYEATGMGFLHYAKAVKEKPYLYGEHIGPHDLEHREYMSGEGKTRQQLARQHGIRFRTLKRTGIEDGIEAARALLHRSRFDEKKCARGLQALREYHRTPLVGKYDERGNQMFGDSPEHDWTSHGSDAFRYAAMGSKSGDVDPAKMRGAKVVQKFRHFSR